MKETSGLQESCKPLNEHRDAVEQPEQKKDELWSKISDGGMNVSKKILSGEKTNVFRICDSPVT